MYENTNDNLSDDQEEAGSPSNLDDEEFDPKDDDNISEVEEVEEDLSQIVYHREEIKGLQLSFPYKPYPIQTEYMKRVITCLDGVSSTIHTYFS